MRHQLPLYSLVAPSSLVARSSLIAQAARTLLVVALAVAGLVGCANVTSGTAVVPGDTIATPPDPEAWRSQQVYAAAALPFEILGKVGMPRGSANLRWRQQGERFDLRFWGPFGAGVATLEGDPTWVRFVRGDVRREGDPGAILADELGWRVPVAALAWWVRGLPAPDQAVEALSFDGGRLRGLRQSGWTVAIERYAQQADGGALPEKVTAVGSGGRFTLVIQSWQKGEADPAAEPSVAEPARPIPSESPP